MPARRKPAKVLEINGGFKHNPNRKRADPDLEKISEEPPAHISVGAKQVWEEIISIDRKNQHIKSNHAIALEMLCEEIAEYRALKNKTGAETKKNIRMMLKDFLMTPSDSLRLGVATTEKETNRFSEYTMASG